MPIMIKGKDKINVDSNLVSLYKRSGFVEEGKEDEKPLVTSPAMAEKELDKEPEKEPQNVDEVKDEKPSRTEIMKMNKEQLLAYAEKLGVDVKADATNKELQAILIEK